MVSLLQLYADFVVWPGLALLLLLTLGLPGFLNRWLRFLVLKVLYVKVHAGRLNIPAFWILNGGSAVMLWSAYNAMSRAFVPKEVLMVSPDAASRRAMYFRAERTFWVAMTSFFVYTAIAAIIGREEKIDRMKREEAALREEIGVLKLTKERLDHENDMLVERAESAEQKLREKGVQVVPPSPPRELKVEREAEEKQKPAAAPKDAKAKKNE